MISGTVQIKRPAWTWATIDRIAVGMNDGVKNGVDELVRVIKSSIREDSRFPTGELEDSVTAKKDIGYSRPAHVVYDVTVGTDHARSFEEGTKPHFVPYADADFRIRNEVFYPHIKPVRGNHNSPTAPITGYIASSEPRHSTKEAFEATAGYIVQEVRNCIHEEIEYDG